MSLSKKFIEIEPDVSGSRSSNRFGFQTDWAICELLQKFAAGEDFIFLFDYHEDVVVITPNESGSDYFADFYQVKTKDTGKLWTKADIIKGRKSKKKNDSGIEETIELPSILGKLYLNKYNFKDGVKSLNFISNAKFSFKLKSGIQSDNNEIICLVDLDTEELKEFTEPIRLSYKLTHSCDFPKYTYFKITNVSLNGSGTFTTGKVAEVLEELYPATSISSKKIYQVIADDIKRKNSKEKVYNDFSHLTTEKGITRNEIEKIFNSNIQLSTDNKWKEINQELRNDNFFNFNERQILHDKYREIYLRAPFNKKLFGSSTEQVNDFYKIKCTTMSLSESVNYIFEKLDINGFSKKDYDTSFIKSIILFSIYEH